MAYVQQKTFSSFWIFIGDNATCNKKMNHVFMDGFSDLHIWKKAMAVTKGVYVLTRQFPTEERFSLTSQIRRSTTSILANIAEGFGRYTYPDKANKYVIARGEAMETKAFLLIAKELGLADQNDIQRLLDMNDEVLRMLSGLIRTCRAH